MSAIRYIKLEGYIVSSCLRISALAFVTSRIHVSPAFAGLSTPSFVYNGKVGNRLVLGSVGLCWIGLCWVELDWVCLGVVRSGCVGSGLGWIGSDWVELGWVSLGLVWLF